MVRNIEAIKLFKFKMEQPLRTLVVAVVPSLALLFFTVGYFGLLGAFSVSFRFSAPVTSRSTGA